MRYNGVLKSLIGTKVKGVIVEKEGEHLIFVTDQGTFSYYTDGDCCSNSWVEHFSDISNFYGNTITNIKEIDMGVVDSYDDHEYVQCYGVEFEFNAMPLLTSKLEFRNSSNGYYGGSIEECSYDTSSISESDYVKEDF